MLLRVAIVLVLLAALQQATAPAAEAKVVHFDGRSVDVPASWPVYRLAQHPGMCARLDRRAVYLGVPSSSQRCPVGLIGRRRAIVVEPRRAVRARAGASASALPRPLATASTGGDVFTGLGFDACSTPSTRSMAAWTASPYRAIGVYIGGENRACSQPNLTPSWVEAQTAAGWHLIPTYVGLQAPTSSCSSCAKLTASLARSQGTAQAEDAVEQARLVAMGPGSPIYFDMESYSRTASATSATLAFLEAWTVELHQLGYRSGVYSSSASGIADVASAEDGGLYEGPDAIWLANWNGRKDTIDSVVPADLWVNHRIHQYQGGHDETYGGVTINIDNNYVDGDTVGTATAPVGEADPVGNLDAVGSPAPGQVRVRGWALDLNAPTQALGIRLYVGGRGGEEGAAEFELGTATGARPDVAAKRRQAGPNHGFDFTVPTTLSGPQPVCVYALNAGEGSDRLLGCRAITVPVAVTFSNLRATRGGVRVQVRCEWPVETQCPGQLALRARYKVAQRHRRGRVSVRLVTRSLGRRSFHLSGQQSHSFFLPLSASARTLVAQRGSLRAQLIAAIPGGRRVQGISINGG